MYSTAFISAFKFSMRYEVGPKFNFEDEETKKGLCSNRSQQLKTGYVNVAGDRGGETKFGIASASNPSVDIKSLTMDDAMKLYYAKYWLPLGCESLNQQVAINVFDAAINHGPTIAAKMLQRTAGVTADGKIGAITVAATNALATSYVCQGIQQKRIDLFNSIVQRDSSQQKFLKGWLSRIADLALNSK